MVGLNDIEDAIVAALKADPAVDFDDAHINVSIVDSETNNALRSQGGIAVQYAGSTTTHDLRSGDPFIRRVIFIVAIGRTKRDKARRVSEDVDAVVMAVVRSAVAGINLKWMSDRFAFERGGVFWHEVLFEARLKITEA